MPTDDELVAALSRGMQATTDNLNPAPGLATEIRRLDDRARGRRIAAYVAVPVVVGAATATALLVVGGPSGTTAPVAHPAPSVAVAPTTPAAVPSVVSYRLADIASLPSCPVDPHGETVGKTESGVWYLTPRGTCVAIGVDWADSKPSTAQPLNIAGYPDLYATNAGGAQYIYARVAPGTNSYHPAGGWVVLTTSADAPTEVVVRLIIVPSG